MQGFEAALDGTRPHRRPGKYRVSDALEVPGPEVLKLKQTAKKPSRALGDDNHVRLGNALQARRKVRRFTDDAALLRVARPDQVADDDQPGRNPDTGLQRSARLESSPILTPRSFK